MRTKGIWAQVIFALIVVFLFAYIFNLIPTKVNRLYECKVANISKEKIVDEIIIKVDGTINKSFLKKTKFTGNIFIGEEKYVCKNVEFTRNITLLRNRDNNQNGVLVYLSPNDKKILIVFLNDDYLLNEEKVIAYPYKDIEKIKREYYEVIKKMNGV